MDSKAKFETKKSLGQHFLTSAVIPRAMCDAATVTAGDIVVEIGPGTGILTAEILARGAKVIALEADQRAIEVLEQKFSNALENGELTVRHVDVREFSPSELGLESGTFKVVANIPYYLSGLLFRTFLDTEIQPICLVFLVQKEVAKRITSGKEKGTKESLLSLSVKVFGQPKYIKDVVRGNFSPPPKVDSGIILVDKISRHLLEGTSSQFFFDLLHLGFGQKRKQLMGNLTKRWPREDLEKIFGELELPIDVRAEDISIDKWVELAKKLK